MELNSLVNEFVNELRTIYSFKPINTVFLCKDSSLCKSIQKSFKDSNENAFFHLNDVVRISNLSHAFIEELDQVQYESLLPYKFVHYSNIVFIIAELVESIDTILVWAVLKTLKELDSDALRTVILILPEKPSSVKYARLMKDLLNKLLNKDNNLADLLIFMNSENAKNIRCLDESGEPKTYEYCIVQLLDILRSFFTEYRDNLKKIFRKEILWGINAVIGIHIATVGDISNLIKLLFHVNWSSYEPGDHIPALFLLIRHPDNIDITKRDILAKFGTVKEKFTKEIDLLEVFSYRTNKTSNRVQAVMLYALPRKLINSFFSTYAFE